MALRNRRRRRAPHHGFTLVELLVVILGVIVGFIVIALFMPMITLIQNISSPGGGKK